MRLVSCLLLLALPGLASAQHLMEVRRIPMRDPMFRLSFNADVNPAKAANAIAALRSLSGFDPAAKPKEQYMGKESRAVVRILIGDNKLTSMPGLASMKRTDRNPSGTKYELLFLKEVEKGHEATIAAALQQLDFVERACSKKGTCRLIADAKDKKKATVTVSYE